MTGRETERTRNRCDRFRGFADAQKSYAGFDLDLSGNQITGEAYLSGW